MDILDGCNSLNEGLEVLAAKNYPYKDISGMIYKHYGYRLSPNAIGKRLKNLGILPRKGLTLDGENEVKHAIEILLEDLPETVGYRTMTNILRRKGMHVRRKMVMEAMRQIDPSGVEFRRRRRIQRRIYRSMGPNHVWHVDGYDKIKPYGFAIHGCIDGYSRMIMWLTVGPTNNDPRTVATNYVLCVTRVKGCPLVLQVDPGTENTIMGGLQCVFRHDADDCFSGINSFRVSRSVFNQRIEAWWSMLRRRQTQSWIIKLRELEAFGLFHRGNVNETYSLRYCLMPLIQRELDHIRDEWNSHYISYSRQASCPNGRPAILYSMFENTGGKECLQPISEDDLEWAMSECRSPSRSGSFEFDHLANTFFQENNYHDEYTWNEAIHNYNLLRLHTTAM